MRRLRWCGAYDHFVNFFGQFLVLRRLRRCGLSAGNYGNMWLNFIIYLLYCFKFRYITIACACMATYRSKHIKENTIAMVPVYSYLNNTKYSPDSLLWWLDYIAFSEGISIEHGLIGSGEERISVISVDCNCEATNTILQYHVSFCAFFS